MKFIQEYGSGKWPVIALARRHGISRKTAYKFVDRYLDEGLEGLRDRSRARHTQAHRTPPEIERKIVRAARRYRSWGPRKILVVLRRDEPTIAWPAKSTIGDILKKHDLVKERGPRRRSCQGSSHELAPPTGPNDLWCTDFKGWCLSSDRQRLEPFALGDGFSRFAIACALVKSTAADVVWPIFERSFREYGLPRRIRSDNGTPFATIGLAGLSRLSVRWLRLGIRPERIRPGKPQQNGMLERFNLTLKLEAMSPPAKTRPEQARALERFRRDFNEVRPHEALGDRTPAEVYVESPRKFSGEVPEFEYGSRFVVRCVDCRGFVMWNGRLYFLSEILAGERVGFEQVGPTHWSIQLGPLEVALLNDQTHDILRHERLVWVDGVAAHAS